MGFGDNSQVAAAKKDILSQGTPPAPSRPVREVASFIRTLAILFAIAIVLRGSVVEAFKIPSGSMIPTLQITDHILVSKFSFGLRLPFVTRSIFNWSMPKHGDIVVFTRPDDPDVTEDKAGMNIIKRVIGLPGDKIELQGTRLTINGVLQPEPYARYSRGGVKDFGPEVVPPGHVFLMGDNRDESLDARFWHTPFLDVSRIKGRALIIYWSWFSMDRIGHLVR